MKTTKAKATSVAAAQWQLWLDGKDDLLEVWNMPPSPQDAKQHERQRAGILAHEGFYGASEETARKVISKGWPHGAKLVESLARKVEEQLAPPKSRRRTRKWADDGDEISLERLEAGSEYPWLSSHRKLKSACGLVEVVSSWGDSCGASQQQLQWSGAAALCLTDMLEKADYSVELALIAAMNTSPAMIVRVDLKRMGELVDLEQLAAIAVYPPAWRIYGLASFQLGPTQSGDGIDSHPHSSFERIEANGMWNYRPNVMTLELHGADSERAAVSAVTEALKTLESLVNPQDLETY